MKTEKEIIIRIEGLEAIKNDRLITHSMRVKNRIQQTIDALKWVLGEDE